MRFVAVQEPPHHSWAVVDTINDAPVEFAGRVLIGLTSREARWFAAVANDPIWPRGGRRVAWLRVIDQSADGRLPALEKHGRTAG
ncbi:MAG: hypothetical protein EOR60_08355 [Mesorhizobium sp.]|nr:MAG: hypothetical protein EOR60_08355 [Mesorhizobium sp.]